MCDFCKKCPFQYLVSKNLVTTPAPGNHFTLSHLFAETKVWIMWKGEGKTIKRGAGNKSKDKISEEHKREILSERISDWKYSEHSST